MAEELEAITALGKKGKALIAVIPPRMGQLQ
jgi:hypothetical protein